MSGTVLNYVGRNDKSLAIALVCAVTVILYFIFPYTMRPPGFSPHVPFLILGALLALAMSSWTGLPRMEWFIWLVWMGVTGLSILAAPEQPDIVILRGWLFSLLAFWLCRIGFLLISERSINVAAQILLALYAFSALSQVSIGDIAYVSLWFGQPVGARYATGLAAYTNQAALLFLPLLVLTLGANLQRPRWWRWALWAVGCAALYLTLSRAGWLALLVSLGVFALFMSLASRETVHGIVMHVFVGMFAGLIAWASPTRIDCYEWGGQCAAGRWEVTDYSARTRAVTLRIAALAIADYPLTGIGLGQFPKYYSTHIDREMAVDEIDSRIRMSPHNAYAQFAAELGLPSFLVLLFALGMMLRFPARNRSPIALALYSSCLGVLAWFLFHDGFVDRLFWILLGCTVALGGSRQTKLQTSP